MKNFLILVVASVSIAGHTPANADPRTDLQEFRAFFAQKFPTVKFEDYSKGFIVLPGLEEYKTQWDTINELSPHEIGVAEGVKLWETPFVNGKTFAGCFKNGGKNIAQGYPYWDKPTQKVRTAEMDLLDCMGKNDPALATQFKDLKTEAVRVRFAGLVAAFYSLSTGQKANIDLSDPDARAAYEDGKKSWWSRRGQLNFSCSNCHMDLAGKNFGGNQPLSAGLGHPLGWPGQRGLWERLELVHFRYQTCNSQVRAKPFELLSETYNNLQLYETYMSSGIPLTAPSYRGY